MFPGFTGTTRTSMRSACSPVSGRFTPSSVWQRPAVPVKGGAAVTSNSYRVSWQQRWRRRARAALHRRLAARWGAPSALASDTPSPRTGRLASRAANHLFMQDRAPTTSADPGAAQLRLPTASASGRVDLVTARVNYRFGGDPALLPDPRAIPATNIEAQAWGTGAALRPTKRYRLAGERKAGEEAHISAMGDLYQIACWRAVDPHL